MIAAMGKGEAKGFSLRWVEDKHKCYIQFIIKR